MRLFLFAASIMLSGVPALAQPRPTPQPATEATSEATRGEPRLTEPRPIAEAEDPVNRLVAAQTVPGLALSVTIDGARVTLDSATPAMLPRQAVRRDRPLPAGDGIRVTGLADGREVAATVVPDPSLNAQEGVGVVRLSRRQAQVLLASDRPIDTITVEAAGARATLDVRAAYAPWCRERRDDKICPSVQR